MEARVAIYHLQGKSSIWWDQLVKLEDIDENKISWRKFKKYFQKEYLSEHYYDKKMEELFELKLRSMTMEAYEKKFLELLNYANFIKYEKVNIQRFLSGLPESYRDKIQYDRPKKLKDAIWKEKHLYEQNKSKAPYQKKWKDMKNNKQEQRKKVFRPSKFRNNNSYQQG